MSQDEEQELDERQPTGLLGIGRALRATYDAENHDSLGNDLTGLMLQLARVEEEAPTTAPTPAPASQAPTRLSWLSRMLKR